MTELRGENPRLLQGLETAAGPVDDLREAISVWTPVTVELRNYRRDGTPFRNRVSLVPIAGDDGTIRNWVGIQKRGRDGRQRPLAPNSDGDRSTEERERRRLTAVTATAVTAGLRRRPAASYCRL